MDKLAPQRQQILKAQAFLQRMLEAPENEIQQAATIQAFEFCFELAWKYLKTLVEDDGSLVASPKAVFREAARHGFIDNPGQWLEFLQARNLTVHTYIEAVALKVYGVIKNEFTEALQKLVDTNSEDD